MRFTMGRFGCWLRSIWPGWGWSVLAGLLLLGIGPHLFQAHATTIYSYIDEQGNPRFSDSIDNIPEKYREKVKTHEQAASQERPPTVLDSIKAVVQLMKQKVAGVLQGLGMPVPAVSVKTGSGPSGSQSSNFSASQTQILTYAGVGAGVLLVLMYLSTSPMMRLLGLGLLIVLGIGAPILMYVSEDGPADIMKQRAIATGQAQYDRLKQVGP